MLNLSAVCLVLIFSPECISITILFLPFLYNAQDSRDSDCERGFESTAITAVGPVKRLEGQKRIQCGGCLPVLAVACVPGGTNLER